MTGRFGGRVALVTSGAQGIDASVAMRLASEGAVVAIADLSIQRAEDSADEMQMGGLSRTGTSCCETVERGHQRGASPGKVGITESKA